MWRIFNRLFGWDYIYWEYTYMKHDVFKYDYRGVNRIRKLPNGSIYYRRAWCDFAMVVIKKSSQVEWLTCDPSKYLGERK